MTIDSAVHEQTDLLSSYAYSYPHKSSYERLSAPVQIEQAWKAECRDRLSLYLHIPFCEMRCGFCNLFTQSQPNESQVEQYLAALKRQMLAIRDAVPGVRFSQFAIGGGTPTHLTAGQLHDLLKSVESTFKQVWQTIPTSVETSPATATNDRMRVLAEFGVRRISLGVQSFLESETRLFGRPQTSDDVFKAIQTIRRSGTFELNLDLIYGHPAQTQTTWQSSLNEAMAVKPEEIYLYPLYIRPQTGLSRQNHCSVEHRSDLYRAARDRLLQNGYQQLSLRCFRLPHCGAPTAYSCQRDGMIGLGCGARSYTQRLHYATRFAVTQAGVRMILREWMEQTVNDFALATHGIWLSEEEQLRRYVVLTLLQAEGMTTSEFANRFPQARFDELSGVAELRERDWLRQTDQGCQLTELGLEHSDEVGPLLYSAKVRTRLREFITAAPHEA